MGLEVKLAWKCLQSWEPACPQGPAEKALILTHWSNMSLQADDTARKVPQSGLGLLPFPDAS